MYTQSVCYCLWTGLYERHPLYEHAPAPSCLKSRKSFLTSVTPLEVPPSEAHIAMWKDRLANLPHSPAMNICPDENLPPGWNTTWAKWKCLNRLRAGVGRSKVSLSKWGYSSSPTICDCETEPQTMEHLLKCPLLKEPCTAADLAQFSSRAQQCVQHWLDSVWLSVWTR